MEVEQVDKIYAQTRDIDGWFLPHAARLFGILDECQRQQGVTGDLFEIGVWHGKSAILLGSMIAPGESLIVCDLFDDAGEGGESKKLQRFRQNIGRFFKDAGFLRIHAKSSRELSPADVSTNCRLIHVDGGHDTHNVYADMVLADACLNDQGAVIMDDVYAPAWPGVMDGIYRFFELHPGRLVPLVTGFKKMVLVRPNALATYSPYVNDNSALTSYFARSGPYICKPDEIVGQQIHCYFDRPTLQAAFCPGMATAAFKRMPWLRNRYSRWINQKLRNFRRR